MYSLERNPFLCNQYNIDFRTRHIFYWYCWFGNNIFSPLYLQSISIYFTLFLYENKALWLQVRVHINFCKNVTLIVKKRSRSCINRKFGWKCWCYNLDYVGMIITILWNSVFKSYKLITNNAELTPIRILIILGR